MPLNDETNLSDVAGAMAVELGPTVISQINRKTTLLSRLMKVAGQGKTNSWDVRFSGASAGTYTEGAAIADSDLDADDRVQASNAWGLYRSAFGISSLTRAVTGNSPSSPDEFVELAAADARASAAELASQMNVDAFSGSSGIIGLDSALAASGTYAGLSKATYAEWAGNVLANGGSARSLTKALIDELEEDIYTACGMSPDMIVTTPAIVRKYGHLFDSKLQVMTARIGELTARGDGSNAGPRHNVEAGETGYTYNGIQVLRDKDATAGHFYMLNSEFVDFRAVSVRRDRLGADAAAAAREMGLADTDLFGHFSVLGKDGSRDRFMLEIFPQMRVKRVNAHGFIDDIDES